MKNRFTALMTTLILSVFFAVSASAYDVEVDGIYYNLISKGNVAEVTKGDEKYSGSINIPSSIKVSDVDYAVTSIGYYAFQFCSGLTSITFRRVGGQVPDSLLSWNCRRSAISGCQCVPFGVLAKVMRNYE